MTTTSRTDYVTLISSDDYSFVILRSSACLSPVIKRMLDPQLGFAESRTNTCYFDNINGLILERVCEYLYYNEKNRDAKDVADLDIPTELVLELVIAADYLQV